MTETGLGKMPKRTPQVEVKPRPEPRQLHIEPQVFAHVVEAMHTLAQQQPQQAADINAMREQMYELSVGMAGLMDDIRSIAQAVGVQAGPLVLRQPQQHPYAPPQAQQHGQGAPSQDRLAQALRAIPGIGPEDRNEHAERAANNKR